MSHNASFCNTLCAHFCYKIVLYGMFDKCIVGYVTWVFYENDNLWCSLGYHLDDLSVCVYSMQQLLILVKTSSNIHGEVCYRAVFYALCLPNLLWYEKLCLWWLAMISSGLLYVHMNWYVAHKRHGALNHQQFKRLFSSLSIPETKEISKLCISGSSSGWPIDPLGKGLVIWKVFPCHDINTASYTILRTQQIPIHF